MIHKTRFSANRNESRERVQELGACFAVGDFRGCVSIEARHGYLHRYVGVGVSHV